DATEASDAANAASPEAARELRSLLPKEAIVTDWHYVGAPLYPSLNTLRADGFEVVAASWCNPLNVAYLSRAAAEAGAMGLLQTTWAGRYPTERVLASESRQYAALLLTAEYAWSGRTDLPDEWDYSPGEQFAQAWAAGPPDTTVRPGALVRLDRPATLPLAESNVLRAGWMRMNAEHVLSPLPRRQPRLS